MGMTDGSRRCAESVQESQLGKGLGATGIRRTFVFPDGTVESADRALDPTRWVAEDHALRAFEKGRDRRGRCSRLPRRGCPGDIRGVRHLAAAWEDGSCLSSRDLQSPGRAGAPWARFLGAEGLEHPSGCRLALVPVGGKGGSASPVRHGVLRGATPARADRVSGLPRDHGVAVGGASIRARRTS